MADADIYIVTWSSVQSLSNSWASCLICCTVTVSTAASRQHLRATAGHQLVIPSHRFTTYGCRAFSVAGPMFWNSLPRNLRDPSYTAAVFGRSLKTFFSQSTSVHSASEAFATMRYINWCFTYLLTLWCCDVIRRYWTWRTSTGSRRNYRRGSVSRSDRKWSSLLLRETSMPVCTRLHPRSFLHSLYSLSWIFVFFFSGCTVSRASFELSV